MHSVIPGRAEHEPGISRFRVQPRGCPGTTVGSLLVVRRVLPQFEGAEMKFLRGIGRGHCGGLDQRERRVGELLPDREIISRDREPSESEHVAAGLGDVPDLLPADFIDAQSFST